jgi:hypothetical protein
MRFVSRWVLVALALAACGKSRTPVSEPSQGAAGHAGASATVAGSAADSGVSAGPAQVSKRDCARTEYSTDYTVPDNAQCRSHADCGSLGKCIGLPQERCEYDDGPGLVGDTCQEDSDCTVGANGRCPRVLATTLCVYETCQTDADCMTGLRCVCANEGGSGDHVCTSSNCGDDLGCPENRECKVDESVGGIPRAWVQHCTTEHDECSSRADCDPNDINRDWCGYDFKRQLWTCGPFTLID